MKKISMINEPIIFPKLDAYPFQQEAFDTIKDLEYAAIFHEQGLGKTKIAIDTLLYWLKESSIDTVLIVTKKQLVQNWKKEFKLHTFIDPAILSNDKAANRFVFLSPARVVITNFETLQVEKEQVLLFLKTRNVAIIIDESAKLKNPSSNLTKTYFELSTLFKKRLILTGTPVSNRPYDIWAQIFFLDQGASLGTDFEVFKAKTNLTNKLADNAELQNALELELSKTFDKIRKFSVRETKKNGVLSLPDKIYIRYDTILSPEQNYLYQKIRNELTVEIIKKGEKITDDSSAIVKRLLRLVQVASNPLLVDDSFQGESAKEKTLLEIIKRILENKEKCIVWSSFIENVEQLSNMFKQQGVLKIHGRMNMEDRNRAVEKFKLDGYNIMFATPASAKEGLTLTEANHVIFYDRGFSLDDYLQAQDRIHRISQQKTCYIHNIIASNTIDEWIEILISAKQEAAALTQGDLSLDEFRLKIDYSFGDVVKEILGS